MIGLFGGAFDPPHNGHRALALAALERFPLERLLVLVSARPGHKEVVLAPELRLRLAAAAFADVARARVELDPHAFTVDLLRERRFADPLFLIGADQLAALPTWKEPEEVLRLARLGVATRPDVDRSRLEAVLAHLPAGRVELFEIEPVAVSSRDVRARASCGDPIDALVPPAVARLVAELDLYREPAREAARD